MANYYGGIMDVKKNAFLKAFAKCGIVTMACKISGVNNNTVYGWKEHDDVFLCAFNQARQEAIEMLETEALRRATEGVDKPVYQRGVCVGTVKEYSDTLLLALLKANDPKKYREKQEITHIGLTAKVYEGVTPDDV